GDIAPAAGPTTRPIANMQVTVTSTLPLSGHDNMREISISISVPTGPPLANRPGQWQLKLTETAGVAAEWDAWVSTSQPDPYPTFRPPDQPAADRRRVNTIDSPGTARDAITVAS